MRALTLRFFRISLYSMLALCLAASNARLQDLSQYSAAAPAVQRMVSQGIIQPIAPGVFSPKTRVTRGDFAGMLQRMFSLRSAVPYMNPQVFCFGCLIPSGFNPRLPVSRAESTVYVLRILAAQGRVHSLSPSQLRITLRQTPGARNWSPYLAPLLAVAVHDNIAPPEWDGMLRPNLPLTRLDAAVFLDRVQRVKQVPRLP